VRGPDAAWRFLVGGVADLVWPAVCPICDDFVERERRGLHTRCLSSLDPAPVLELHFEVGRAPVHALLADSESWFAVLHRVKYGGEFSLLDPVVDALVSALRRGGGVDERTVFVPVPDDPVRRRLRGGSVVAAVARRLAIESGGCYRDDLVCRRRSTESQTAQESDVARAANVRGIFGPSRLAELSSEARLVIVDDQATSGATIRAVAESAGIRGHPMAVLVLARARRTPRVLEASQRPRHLP